jgi:uncharacterized protein YndB with AHSA1/START domain
MRRERNLEKNMNTTTSKLQITTPSDLEIVMTREFNAPRVLVWQAWTQPEHVKNWWGCAASTITHCEIDLRVGGTWRYVMDVNGEEFGFHGVYREIHAPEKLVHSQIFEPMPQHEVLVTVVFEERNGVTTMTETLLHANKEARDGHLQSGIETGAAQSMDKLDEVLASLAGENQ